MDDTADVRAGLVDGRVQSEASLADAQPCRPGVHNLSTNIYLDQRAGSDFWVHHAKWVDQELFMFLTQPGLKHSFQASLNANRTSNAFVAKKKKS